MTKQHQSTCDQFASIHSLIDVLFRFLHCHYLSEHPNSVIPMPRRLATSDQLDSGFVFKMGTTDHELRNFHGTCLKRHACVFMCTSLSLSLSLFMRRRVAALLAEHIPFVTCARKDAWA